MSLWGGREQGHRSVQVRVSHSWTDYLPRVSGSLRPPPRVADWPGVFTGLWIGSYSHVTVEGYNTGHGLQRGRHRWQRPDPAPSPLPGELHKTRSFPRLQVVTTQVTPMITREGPSTREACQRLSAQVFIGGWSPRHPLPGAQTPDWPQGSEWSAETTLLVQTARVPLAPLIRE